MEFIIATDMKSFLFSINVISDHQFGFRPRHSNWDMLLLLSHQGCRPLISDMRSGPSLWTYLELLIQFGIRSCSPNCLSMESKANSTLRLPTSSALSQHLYRFADYSTLCRNISHPSDRQEAASHFPLLRPWQNHRMVKHNFLDVSILSSLWVLPSRSSLPASLVCPAPSAFSLSPAVGVSTFSCCSLCYGVSCSVLYHHSSMSIDHVLNKNKQ